MSSLSTVRALGQPGRLHAKATHACAGEGRHLFTLYLSTCGEQKDGPGIKDATPFFYSPDGSELLRTLLTINSQRLDRRRGSVFTKTESSASLDRLAKKLAASRRKVRACEPLDMTRRVERQRSAG